MSNPYPPPAHVLQLAVQGISLNPTAPLNTPSGTADTKTVATATATATATTPAEREAAQKAIQATASSNVATWRDSQLSPCVGKKSMPASELGAVASRAQDSNLETACEEVGGGLGSEGGRPQPMDKKTLDVRTAMANAVRAVGAGLKRRKHRYRVSKQGHQSRNGGGQRGWENGER